jgi:hypothetical protein
MEIQAQSPLNIIIQAVITIRDPDGNIKFSGPVTFTPLPDEDNNNGSDPNNDSP